jgi:hypothetical protein
MYLLLFIVASVLLLASVFCLIKLHHTLSMVRDKAWEQGGKMAEQAEVNTRLQLQLEGLRRKYLELYRRQFNEIGKYFDGSFARNVDSIPEKASHALLDKLNSMLTEISAKESGQKQLEKRLNADLDNIVYRIRADFPKFTEKDIRFICYLIVGFDSSTISYLMDISKENARVKKARLLEKISNHRGKNELFYRLFV